MQRICRELGGLKARGPALCPGRRSPTCGLTCSRQPGLLPRRWAGGGRPLTGQGRRGVAFVSQRHRRLFGSQPGGGTGGTGGGQPDISVVGIPDPITWIRCRVTMFLIQLYFELDINSEEFERGVKQALVHVSDMMSSDRYHRLVGLVSNEMIDYVKTRCKSLTAAQRRQLAVAMEDIIFIIPEDVTVVFDDYGRKFCHVVMRFWFLSTCEGPDDPEGTKIFKVSPSDDSGPQKKVVTAVYEFHRELTRGASPDWMVTTVWHWHWKAAE